jgi:ATPase subunit of ABC transporter with duplicated ATPase domains
VRARVDRVIAQGGQAKSKARFKAYDELVKAANDRQPGEAQVIIPVGERLGQVVIDADHLSKGYATGRA